MMDQKKIGMFIKELRNESGKTQEQVAEELGVSNRTVSRWENGNNMPDMSMLVEVSKLFSVDVSELFNGERNDKNMQSSTNDIAIKANEYGEIVRKSYEKRLLIYDALAIIGILIKSIIDDISLTSFSVSELIGISGLAVAFIACFMSIFYITGLYRVQDAVNRSVKHRGMYLAALLFILIINILFLICNLNLVWK